MNDRLPSIHPGDILREEYLEPLGITAYRLAKGLGVPQTRIAGILAGRRAVTADTALRLGRFFGTSARFWLNMQATYELQEAQRRHIADLERIEPYPMPHLHGSPTPAG